MTTLGSTHFLPIFFSCLITFLKKWSASSIPKPPVVFISNMHLKQWNNPHYDHSTSVSFMSKECLTWHLKGRLFCIVWFEKKMQIVVWYYHTLHIERSCIQIGKSAITVSMFGFLHFILSNCTIFTDFFRQKLICSDVFSPKNLSFLTCIHFWTVCKDQGF